MTVATADLYDERGDELQSLPLQLRSFGAAAFDGPIRTVRCFEDNSFVKDTLATPGEGAVLVVDGNGSLNRALLGDMIGESAQQNGWAGVVIHGAVRDSEQLDTLTIGVKALGTNPRKSVRKGVGELDIELEFGGVTFRPGAHLYSDRDGILVER